MELIDITGLPFGRLIVIKRVLKEGRTESFWLCKCSCGTEKVVSGSALRYNRTQSCGCLHSDMLAKRNNLSKNSKPWEVDMMSYVRRLAYNKRGGGMHTWGLTLKQYVDLVTSNCHYCGLPPTGLPRGVVTRELGLKRNGIDRVNNKVGYEPGNCVPCCVTCNREKGFQEYNQFIANTKRRYAHLKASGNLDPIDLSTEPFTPPLGEFSGCRCTGCPERSTPKRECWCCTERRAEEKNPDPEPFV